MIWVRENRLPSTSVHKHTDVCFILQASSPTGPLPCFGGGLYILDNNRVIHKVFREGPNKECDASLEDFSMKSSLELLVSEPNFVTWVKLLPRSPEVATGCSPATLEPHLELLRHFEVASFWSYFCIIASFKTNNSKKYSKFSQKCK